MDNGYWIEGKVSIPEGRRAEFNENVRKLFRLCGIRKLEEIEIAGKICTVVHEPEPDDRGILSFDYSVFERRKREISTYDMNTCELHVEDRGYEEFGLVMNLIMTMQEAYSTEPCCLMRKDQVISVYGYALMIERTAGIKLTFPNREKAWNMLLFLKSTGKYEDIDAESIWDKFPFGYGKMELAQFAGCMACSYKSPYKPEKLFDGEKSELKEAGMMQRVYYVYELLCGLLEREEEEKVREFLKDLLEKKLPERECLAQREDDFGSIAKASLYDLPPCIVTAYAWALQKEFWEVWFSLKITGYEDIETREKKEAQKEAAKETEEKEPEKKRIFYEAILRDNEDEFLEFWDTQDLYLSNDMQMNLEEWKENFAKIDESEVRNMDGEAYLADILWEMETIWGCRYADREIVREFIGHCAELPYQKCLLIFRRLMDEETEYFPELTKRQVKEWIVRRVCVREDRTQISGYASLLGNRTKRFELLGF